MTLKPAERVAADLVWRTFSTSGRWPDRHALLLALDDANLSLPDAAGVLSGVSIHPSYDSPSLERVRLNLRGWVGVDDAQSMLRPLGQVVARLATGFAENPVVSGGTAERKPWSSFRDLWSRDDEWNRVTAIIRAGLESPLQSSQQMPDEMFFSPSFDILRFDGVQSLEDVLRVLSDHRRRIRIGAHPAGQHRALLVRAFDYAQRHHEWPSAISFAVRERKLGFVPDLQRDLSTESYVRSDFSWHAHARIELTPEALTTVDPSGEGRKLLLRVLAECRSRWRQSPSVEVTSTELATAMGVDEGALKPWLLFVEFGPWRSGSTLSGAGAWSLHPNELILRFRDVESWDEYLAVLKRDRGSGTWPVELARVDADQAPVVPDLSSSRIRLKRLLMQDDLSTVIEGRLEEFDRVFAVQAWQSAMIHLGSAMEGVLLDVLNRNPGKAEPALPNPKRKLTGAGLGDLVLAAERLELVHANLKVLAVGLKDFRDLVHPNRAAASTLRPTAEAVRAGVVAFENLVVELEQAIDDGRMLAFEQS